MLHEAFHEGRGSIMRFTHSHSSGFNGSLVCAVLWFSVSQTVIRESVDSLCRDDADMPNAAIHTKSLQPPQRCIC